MSGWRRWATWQAGTGVAVAAVLAGFAFGTRPGLGMALGIAGTAAQLWGLWLVVRLIGRVSAQSASDPQPVLGVVLTLAGFAATQPLWVVAWMAAKGLGDPAPTAFLIGLGLVYSALVVWAQSRA